MKKWNISKGFETLDAALEGASYDIVSLCSPTGTHIAALNRLLASSAKAVFAEKPLDGDTKKARAIGIKYNERAIPIVVNFSRRFDASIQALRNEIAAGKYGALVSVTGWYTGGVLNNGSHLVDLTIFLAGRVPAISHVTDAHEIERSADPTISALLLLDDVPFHMVGLRAPGVARFELELCFERHIIVLEEGGRFMRVRTAEPLEIVPEISVAGRGVWCENNSREPFLAALDELVQWRPGVRLSSDIESACEAIAVIAEVHKRAKEKAS